MFKLLSLIAITASLAFAQHSEVQKESLRGLPGASILTTVADTCGNVIDSEVLKQDIDTKLRAAGVKFTGDIMVQLLNVVNCAHLDVGGERIVTAIYVSLILNQMVIVPSQKKLNMGMTWVHDNVYACGYQQKCGDVIRKATREFVDEFVSDYLEVNPK